jgi:c-di-AMP phosphodiesterase-like protein
MQNNNKRIATRLDIAICVALACLVLVVSGILLALTPLDSYTVVLLCAFGYLFLLFIYAAMRLGTESLSSDLRLHEAFDGELEKVISNLGQPAFLCDINGRIQWCNRELVDLIGRHDLVIGSEIDDVCSLNVEALNGDTDGAITGIGDRLYHYEGIPVVAEGQDLWFVLFTDCTEYEQLRALHEAETVSVAYIVIDNIEELLQYVQDTYRSAANAVEDAVKNWVHDMGGVLKLNEKDKYIAFFDVEHLKKCIERRFDVLDSVRSVRVGDGMPVTVSIGVSAVGGSLEEKEAAAQAALDMALQRGGDQAVVRSEIGYEYFGGKTKAIQKRTNVRSRVVATELCSLMARTESVLIMGHRFGDFDSFGSAVGMARLAMMCGVRPHIVINTQDPNLAPCFEKLEEIEDYNDVFVGSSVGMDLIRPDTLLIVVDVNNLDHVECPDIVRSVRDLAIIDHHRKTTEFPREPLLAYIEPSASSASELVSEILEQHMFAKSLLKEEAELLLAGILLDTKQFTRNTGSRTFGAALFLRGEGAIPGESNDLFRSDVNDLTKEARFHTNVLIYRERIAISYVDEGADASYRVLAAKAADKLLTVKGVYASFALVTIGNRVHISARSDGNINVQLILEALNGGGHYDVAGAQVEGENMQAVIVRLREAIDRYLDQ